MKSEAKVVNYKLSIHEDINLRKITDLGLNKEQGKVVEMELSADFMTPKFV